MTALAAWQNFYVIFGSSAGALIGLQFVVLSLIASRPVAGNDVDASHAFATPTIVHFGTVLGLSGILSAPWDGIVAAAALWGLMSLRGVGYETGDSLLPARRPVWRRSGRATAALRRNS